METLYTRHRGRITLTVKVEDDYDCDYSWLGKFTELRKADPDRPIYSKEADAIRLPKSELWRDRKGRIVEAPDDDHESREYEFIEIEGGGNGYSDCGRDKLRYCFQDADRLVGLERGEWSFLGILANVRIDNREIGHASVWGFESDMDDRSIRLESLSIASEALSDAKSFLASLRAA